MSVSIFSSALFTEASLASAKCLLITLMERGEEFSL